MKLKINIPEKLYAKILEEYEKPQIVRNILYDAVANGTPIPDNATNGDVIKALFPDIEINNGNMKVYTAIPFGDYVGANIDAMKDWWHSPYERGETNE